MIDQAYDLTKKILEKNYFDFDNILLHCEILIYKKMASEIYTLSTNLVENYPNCSVTFHVLGCYYFLL